MDEHPISTRLAAAATLLAAFAATAGLVATGLYRDAPNWVQQARGTDLATLFVAVPILFVGLWTARRGSAAGRMAVVAGLLYLVYNYAIFAFSVAMNPLTAIHFAIFGLSLWSLLLGARVAVDASQAATDHLHRRASAGLLIAVAGIFGLLWLGQIATTTMTGVLAPDLVLAGISTNPVYVLDLSFFLPLCAVAGFGLLRRDGAAAFGLPMLIWVPLMGAGVLGGFVLGAINGEAVPIVVASVIGTLCVASASLAVMAIVRPPAGVADPAHRPGGVSRPAPIGG
jgi:hypothetical protein